MARLQAALPSFRQGAVWFPSNMTFTADVTTELLQFPAGKNDDYVDTVTMVVNWTRLNSVLLQHGERGYADEEEDDEDPNQHVSYGYWAQLAKRR